MQTLGNRQQFAEVHHRVAGAFHAEAVIGERLVAHPLVSAQGSVGQTRQVERACHRGEGVVDAGRFVVDQLGLVGPAEVVFAGEGPLEQQVALDLFPIGCAPEMTAPITSVGDEVEGQRDAGKRAHGIGAGVQPARAPEIPLHRGLVQIVAREGFSGEMALPGQFQVVIVRCGVQRVGVGDRVPIVMVQPTPVAMGEAQQDLLGAAGVAGVVGDEPGQRQVACARDHERRLVLADRAGEAHVHRVTDPVIRQFPGAIFGVGLLLGIQEEGERLAGAGTDQFLGLRVPGRRIGLAAEVAGQRVGGVEVPVQQTVADSFLGLVADAVGTGHAIIVPGGQLADHRSDVAVRLGDEVVGLLAGRADEVAGPVGALQVAEHAFAGIGIEHDRTTDRAARGQQLGFSLLDEVSEIDLFPAQTGLLPGHVAFSAHDRFDILLAKLVVGLGNGAGQKHPRNQDDRQAIRSFHVDCLLWMNPSKKVFSTDSIYHDEVERRRDYR